LVRKPGGPFWGNKNRCSEYDSNKFDTLKIFFAVRRMSLVISFEQVGKQLQNKTNTYDATMAGSSILNQHQYLADCHSSRCCVLQIKRKYTSNYDAEKTYYELKSRHYFVEIVTHHANLSFGE